MIIKKILIPMITLVIMTSVITFSNVYADNKGKLPHYKSTIATYKSNNDEPTQGGCSWYCGVGLGDITASSTKKAYKKVTYQADNMGDEDLNTAWVENAKGDGVGETFEYELYSDVSNAALEAVELFNGYRKTDKLWHENGRVKLLKMYINDQPYAILEVADTKELQTFEVGEVKMKHGVLMKVKFEIMDVYKGTKYADTAITELQFNGSGVH